MRGTVQRAAAEGRCDPEAEGALQADPRIGSRRRRQLCERNTVEELQHPTL